jgi:hypothetical protein
MIDAYLTRFRAEDLDRILRFLVMYTRSEYALKRVFPRKGPFGRVEPDWKAFAGSIAADLATMQDQTFVRARDRLFVAAPRQYAFVGNATHWIANPRRATERTDAEYLLRVVRDVRNNLFHGGKYPDPDETPEELANDQDLIDSAALVLERCLRLNPLVMQTFVDTA